MMMVVVVMYSKIVKEGEGSRKEKVRSI